ncbi:Protein kinase of the Mitotic Exit Network [Saitoella coloradoensis]
MSGPLVNYTLGDCLGKGAFGAVYRALNWQNGQTVAIKQVTLGDIPKSEVNSLMVEIDLLKNLDHPNIVQYHGFVKTSDYLYIILEYCENGSLHSICKNFGKFPENLVALYIAQVLSGLQYLHDQGVIHRDIKGANILTTKDGLVKLADFGVATRSSAISDATVVGSPYWMAPEVIELSGATTASDIWSVGCTVIELLDGRPPYYNLDPLPALFRIVNDDHPPIPEGASPAVRDFLMQCFQKDPNLRVSAKKLLKHPLIMAAKKGEAFNSVLDQPTTKYDDAVKSVQQWNEALKTPQPSANGAATLRRMPGSNNLQLPSPNGNRRIGIDFATVVKPPPVMHVTAAPKNDPKTFQSPEHTFADKWDDDFDSDASIKLRRPFHRPEGKVVGLGIQRSLTPIPSLGGTNIRSPEPSADDWSDDFEGGLSLSKFKGLGISGATFDDDQMKTIRPSSANRKALPPLPHAKSYPQPQLKNDSNTIHPLTGNGDETIRFSPKARPSTIHSPTQKKRAISPWMNMGSPRGIASGSSMEDYSHWFASETDDSLAQKVDNMNKDNSMSPRLFHPSDLQGVERPVPSPGMHRRGSSQADPDFIPLRHSQSLAEIARFAENEEEENDYSVVFGRDSFRKVTSSDKEDLKLLTKLSDKSRLGDNTDEDDPFAEIDEELDAMSLDANIARDKYAKLCSRIEQLTVSLRTDEAELVLVAICEELLGIFEDNPALTANFMLAHGLLPVLDILEVCKRRDLIHRLLNILNMVIADAPEAQENLCFVGGISVINKFCSKKYANDIRLEAALIVQCIMQTSTLSLQMFVSCRGLDVLVGFLEEDYETLKELVWIGVNGIWSVFALQGATPKNDFCRIFAKSGVLDPLSLTLQHILQEEDEYAQICADRIVHLLLLFSQADAFVKSLLATRTVLRRVMRLLPDLTSTQLVVMLKVVKNISMDEHTLDMLQNANAIEILTETLIASKDILQYKEISNQILNTMYNLCRLSKTRQEEAALAGLVPVLMRIVQAERPLKQFALPILCDLAHAGKTCRRILWQHDGLQFYLSLLSDPYWMVNGLDSILIWFQDEPSRVEEVLTADESIEFVVMAFATSKATAFENILEPLQKLLRLSATLAQALSRPLFIRKLLERLQHSKAIVRLSLLRILRSVCDASPDPRRLVLFYGLREVVHRLAEHDSAVLVQELAKEILNQRWMSPEVASRCSSPLKHDSTRYFDAKEVIGHVGLKRSVRHIPSLPDNDESVDTSVRYGSGFRRR